MKNKLLLIVAVLFLVLPLNIKAISENYVDNTAEIVNVKKDNTKINLYLFHGKECPHCEEEREWLKDIEKKYKNYLNIYYYEVWHDKDNKNLMEKVKKEYSVTEEGVPFTVIGKKYYVGYSNAVGNLIESNIKEYAEIKTDTNEVKIPILGKVNMKKVSLPLVAVVLGFIDGFNPCAMWILLFLINLLFSVKNRKKAWALGLSFLFVSGLVYFLSMLGINFVLGVATIKAIKIAIAIFILIAGILNLRKYFNQRKEEAGCNIVDDKKRKKITKKMKSIMESKSFIMAFVGIIILATCINLIELACSLGFPLIFTEMLTINDITGITLIIYLLIYIFFYMIDDLVVFTISMITVQATGITNKYNKLCTLVSAIIMIIMGLLLIIKPEWLMLNF